MVATLGFKSCESRSLHKRYNVALLLSFSFSFLTVRRCICLGCPRGHIVGWRNDYGVERERERERECDGPSKHAYMGHPYGTDMESATGLRMGPKWVIPFAGCPDGSHITAP